MLKQFSFWLISLTCAVSLSFSLATPKNVFSDAFEAAKIVPDVLDVAPEGYIIVMIDIFFKSEYA